MCTVNQHSPKHPSKKMLRKSMGNEHSSILLTQKKIHRRMVLSHWLPQNFISYYDCQWLQVSNILQNIFFSVLMGKKDLEPLRGKHIFIFGILWRMLVEYPLTSIVGKKLLWKSMGTIRQHSSKYLFFVFNRGKQLIQILNHIRKGWDYSHFGC